MTIIEAKDAKTNTKNYKDDIGAQFTTRHSDVIEEINKTITQASLNGKSSVDIEIELKKNVTDGEFEYLTKQFLEKELKYKVLVTNMNMRTFTVSWDKEAE